MAFDNTPQPPSLAAAGISDNEGQVGKYFNDLFNATLKDGGTFPKVNIEGDNFTSTFSNENMWFEALTLNSGLYVNYTSQNGNIIYGFGCNVRRQAGKAFTVAAQLNAWAGRGAGAAVFGAAIQAVAEPGFVEAIIGSEVLTGNEESASINRKWGINPVFANRVNIGGPMPLGIGSDRYNYNTAAFVLTSQTRSSTGEKCGWTRGLQFIGDCFDQQIPPNWSATQFYTAGMVVISGGRVWHAKLDNLNQAPAVPSTYWSYNSPAGTTAYAIGLDFTLITNGPRMASAIRLTDYMYIHWEATGTIGSYYDSVQGLHILSANNGAPRLMVDVVNGFLWLGCNQVALGGGAAPVLGTIGGAGPTAAAQASWIKFFDGNNIPFWVPAWV